MTIANEEELEEERVENISETFQEIAIMMLRVKKNIDKLAEELNPNDTRRTTEV